jgi:hypothetical protein
MGDDHPFTVEVREHPRDELRFGWKIFESGTAFDESVASFATRREAEADGQKAMRLLVTLGRSRQMTNSPNAAGLEPAGHT